MAAGVPPIDKNGQGPSVVQGTIIVSHTVCVVLIDTGSSRSFIAHGLVRSLGLETEQMSQTIMIESPIGGRVVLDKVCRMCKIVLGGVDLECDLVVMMLDGFDVILGMDWLVQVEAKIECFR